jgi:hypothetical protein
MYQSDIPTYAVLFMRRALKFSSRIADYGARANISVFIRAFATGAPHHAERRSPHVM